MNKHQSEVTDNLTTWQPDNLPEGCNRVIIDGGDDVLHYRRCSHTRKKAVGYRRPVKQIL